MKYHTFFIDSVKGCLYSVGEYSHKYVKTNDLKQIKVIELSELERILSLLDDQNTAEKIRGEIYDRQNKTHK